MLLNLMTSMCSTNISANQIWFESIMLILSAPWAQTSYLQDELTSDKNGKRVGWPFMKVPAASHFWMRSILCESQDQQFIMPLTLAFLVVRSVSQIWLFLDVSLFRTWVQPETIALSCLKANAFGKMHTNPWSCWWCKTKKNWISLMCHTM